MVLVIDNLLSGDKLKSIEEIGYISKKCKKCLRRRYGSLKNNVNYIYYTGKGCNTQDIDFKHTIEEYTKIMNDIFCEKGEWYELVVLGGAGVVWKRSSYILDC